MNKLQVYVRNGVSDVILTKEEDDALTSKYVTMEVELYSIGYELEDGTECDENGTKF